MAEAIRRFKYHGHVELLTLFDELMDDLIQQIPVVDLVIPVPLHISRLRERQFNQSLRIARRAAKRLSRPLLPDGLTRTKRTQPQTHLDRANRRSNVRRAFQLKAAGSANGKRILLVDDVYTTGATVNECARTLRADGADAVYVLTIARMP